MFRTCTALCALGIVILFLPHFTTAQNQLTEIDLTLALKDFRNGEAHLYCQGGFSPIVDRKKEKRFYKKYKVVYHELGCVVPGNLNELKSYNEAVFDLLNFKYGTKWQAMINPDTIGFEEWKKKQD
jgi:hypothetical protein